MGHKHDMIQLFLLKYSVIQNTDQVEVCKRQFYYPRVSLDVILCTISIVYVCSIIHRFGFRGAFRLSWLRQPKNVYLKLLLP